MGLVRPHPPLGLCWAWGRPVPGIPEPALKEAAGQAGSSAPQPWCLPTTLSLSVGKCNGAAGSADLPGGVVAPGRYAGLGPWAGGGGTGRWQGEVGLAIPRRRRWCLWADWGQDSNPGGFSGLGFPWLGYMGRAGLSGLVEALAEQGLGCSLLTHAGARAPGVGAPGGEGDLTASARAPGQRDGGGGLEPGATLVSQMHTSIPTPSSISSLCPQRPCQVLFWAPMTYPGPWRRSQLSKQIFSILGSGELCLGVGKELGVTQQLGVGSQRKPSRVLAI